MVAVAAPRPVLPEGLPEGLLARILDGKVLRADRIAECRRLLLEGPRPDARAVAEAMVREAVRPSHPSLR